ncbi:MAG: sugar phosphorylase [Anaerolineales bacterium]
MTELGPMLITYGDQIQSQDMSPLSTLSDFLNSHLGNLITGVHVLPFFPYSSDDGFSIINYREVNPALGTWEELKSLREKFLLMFDLVINHISRQSAWFQGFLEGKEPYTEYFITADPDTDLSRVVRPRAGSLLTPVETWEGTKYVWTTFSSDQMDLNFHNPDVFLEIIKVLLYYVQQGARIIRLDAIAYVWKEVGTSCIHLPQTHTIVKLIRAVLDWVAPGVILITETNVPHQENISYFGDPLPPSRGDMGGDEAQIVYQFPLAPLILHTFYNEDCSALRSWARSLEVPYPSAIFLNFTASHDGIGLRPAEGLLSENEIKALIERGKKHGGLVSYKTDKDGSRSVYELNITFYDALNDPRHPQANTDRQRFLASEAIMLSLAGVPAIYINNLFGSRGDTQALERTGIARSINRKKFQREVLESTLADPLYRQAQVFKAYRQLLRVVCDHPAFHPFASQEVLDFGQRLFALIRTPPEGGDAVLCLINITGSDVDLDGFDVDQLLPLPWVDTLSGKIVSTSSFRMSPFQVLWLKRL